MTMSLEAVPFYGMRNAVELSEFCQDHLASLSRSDQRRWGEVYIRGLVSVPGRKSIKRISDYIVGWRADQCLQQFINQSTWRWEPVRCCLAHTVAGLLHPRAYVLTEAVFPKNGNSSVGVARQYAPSAGRVLNCQLGLAVSLVGDDATCPVNWRLLLPRSWDDDPGRRARTHLPARERHRPRWCAILDAVDEVVFGWHLPVAPVLIDATEELDVELLLRGLEDRGIPFVVQVRAQTLAGIRRTTVGELANGTVRPGPTTLKVRTRNEHNTTAVSRFMAIPVRGEPELARPRSGRLVRRARHLLAQWTVGMGRPGATWLTNLPANQLTELIELVDLVSLQGRADADLAGLYDGVGLRHFEGRSYRGWHHHVTLASAAAAYRIAARDLVPNHSVAG